MADFRTDQAEGLRRLLDRGSVRMMTVAAGSQGVGGTSTVINVAAGLTDRGRRVLVIDEHYGPANVAGLLGVRAQFDLQDVIRQDCSLEEALVQVPGGITVLPAARGARALPGLRQLDQERLIAGFGRLDDRFDVVLIDTRCSANGNPGFFSRVVDDIIVVSSAAAPAITESYSLIKRMGRHRGKRRFHLLLNRVSSEPTARLIFDNMQRVARTHLATPLECLGSVPRDDSVGTASRMFQPVVEAFPTSPSATGFKRIAESIAGWPGARDGNHRLDSLMQRMLTSSKSNFATAGA